MAVALIKLGMAVPDAAEDLGKAKLEGMQLALAWALDSSLPAGYGTWFEVAGSFSKTDAFSE